MACSTQPRFKRPLHSFKKSLLRRSTTYTRTAILSFLLAYLILSTCLRQNFIPDTPSPRSPTTAALHLAELAVRDFRQTRTLAARATTYFKNDRANLHILLHKCRIPPVFVSRLGPHGRRHLLARLTRDSDGVPLWVATPKILVIDLQNGLGNRLRALASAMEFAFVTSRVLVVMWVPDAHISAAITDLFDQQVLDNLIFIDQPIPWPINRNHIPESAKGIDRVTPISDKHPAASSFRFFNFMIKDTEFRQRSNRWIRNLWSSHLYIKTAYLIESHHMRDKLTNAFIQSLTPSGRVLDLVHRVETRIGGPHVLRRMVGVHLRSRTIVNDNEDVDHECEYSIDGAKTTDMWRMMSTPKQFIPEMKRVQREWPGIVQWSSGLEPLAAWSTQRPLAVANSDDDPAAVTSVDVSQPPKFFVSVDSVETLVELAAHFSKDRLVTLPRDCDDRGPECVIYAFADIVLLSRTGAMLASGWSSFSEAALRMRIRRHGVHPSSNEGYHVRKSGYDFGIPSVWEKWVQRTRKFLQRLLRRWHPPPQVMQKKRLELCKHRHPKATRR